VERHGINHIDTAASYGDAELRVAPWIAGARRDRFFVATKTGKRTYAEARDEIRLSLQRLGTNHIDLIQLHNLVDEAEWQTAFAPDGALRAAVEARDAGLVRFIGVVELAGALGVILPAATRIQPRLTPLAAAGLATIMVLAIPFHLMRGELKEIVINLALGGLAAFVACGRSR